MDVIVSREEVPLDFLTDEQRANVAKVENKYKENPVKKPKGNMIPRELPVLPMEVKIVQEILTKLGDYSSLGEDEDITSNISELANVLVEVGDLKRFPDEIATLFQKCFTQLSVQIPIISTLLFLLHEKEPEFVNIVIQKVQSAYLTSLSTDQVLTSKLLLRTIACLASAGAFATDGPGGLLEVLETLFVIVNSSSNDFQQHFPEEAIVASYLLAATVPWALEALLRSNEVGGAGKDFLQRLHELLVRLKGAWKSPFNLLNRQSILSKALPDLRAEGGSTVEGGSSNNDDDDNEQVIPLAIHSGVSDSYQETLQVAIHFIELSLLLSSSTSLEFPEIYFMPWRILKQNQLISDEYLQALTSSSTNLIRFDADVFANQMTTIFEQGLVGQTFKKNHTPLTSAQRSNGSPALSYHIGEKMLANKNANFLHGRLSIFTSETNEEIYSCCNLSFVEKGLLFSYIEDILNYFDIIIQPDGTSLGSIKLLMNHLLAVSKLFSINNDRSTSVGKIPIEYFLIECLFHKILSLPFNHQTNSIIIYKLILQYCKYDAIFPPIIALAVNILFLMIPSLDILIIQQLAHWFTFHFINTSLKWPFWDFWIGECGLLKDDTSNNTNNTEGKEENNSGNDNDDNNGNNTNNLSHLYFIRTIIQKLSFTLSDEKLVLILPKEFHHYLQGNHNNITLTYLNNNSQEKPVGDDVIDHFRSLIQQRRKSNEIIDFIETIPIFVQQENRQTLIEVFIEIVASIAHESETLTSLLGMLDLYHDAIQVIVENDVHHQILAVKIFQLCDNHRELLLILLEEMIRRNQLSSVAVANILLSDKKKFFDSIISDPSLIRLINILYDRSIDFVRASLLHRDNLQSSDFPVLDESADLTPSDYDEAMAVIQERLEQQKSNASEGEGEMEEEEGGGAGRGRKRNHRDDDDDAMREEDEVAAELRREEQLFLANEAVKRSIHSSRVLYRVFSEVFVTSLAVQTVEGEWQSELVRHVSISLLSHTWRAFLGFQVQISSQFNQRIVLAEQLSAEVVQVLQQQTPELLQSWSKYLQSA